MMQRWKIYRDMLQKEGHWDDTSDNPVHFVAVVAALLVIAEKIHNLKPRDEDEPTPSR